MAKRTRELEYERRYAYIFFSTVFLCTMLLSTGRHETGLILLDDIAITGVAIFAFIFALLSWNKRSLAGLRKQNDVFLMLSALSLVMQIYGFVVVLEMPSIFNRTVIIGIVLAIANRFI